MGYPRLFPLIIVFFLFTSLARVQSQEPRRPEMPEIQTLWAPWQDSMKAVAADREKKLKNLDYIYMLNLDKLQKDRAAAGDLDGALAAKAEIARLGENQETTQEQRTAMPEALRALRRSYDAAFKGYFDEAAKRNDALLQKYLLDLDGLQKLVTKSGDLEKALLVKREKEQTVEEASKPQNAPNVKVPPAIGSPGMKSENVRSVDATKERPFVNSLGMKFVPVPIKGGPTAGQRVLFGVWDVRVQDYEAYAKAQESAGKKVDGSWKTQERDGVPAGREPDLPVAGVNWEDAQAFCQWLTEKESAEGKLPKGLKYRLPSDEEWSWAVGLPPESGATPAEKSGKNSVDFPWGKDWPPTKKAGNYADETYRAKFLKDTKDIEKDRRWIPRYTDGYATTSPVGSFPANAYGLYDMGGNVWQWCEDCFDKEQKDRVLRGASWTAYIRGALLSSTRLRNAPGGRRYNYGGFRCVLGESAR